MVQAISRWPLTTEARVCAWVSSCGIRSGQSVTGTSLSGFFRFPLSVSFHHESTYLYIIWGINNMLVGGRTSEASSLPIDMNYNIWPMDIRRYR
jgi:hypothetical protein